MATPAGREELAARRAIIMEPLLRDKFAAVSLERLELTAVDAAAFVPALHTATCLETLRLGENVIGDEGARLVAGALMVNSRLTSLSLATNGITAAGAAHMATALQVQALVWEGCSSPNTHAHTPHTLGSAQATWPLQLVTTGAQRALLDPVK
jgi:hypothetical protein